MKESRQKRAGMPKVLRTAAVAAVMVMALAITAGAVNLATEGALFKTLRQVWTDGYETRYEAVDEDGNLMDITVVAGTTLTEENGRMVLHAVGEDIDITDELEENGAYHFEKVTECRTVVVDVTGTPEDWSLTESVTDENGDTYTTAFTSGDMVNDVNIATAVISGGTDETGVENIVTVTTTENGVETVTNATDEAE